MNNNILTADVLLVTVLGMASLLWFQFEVAPAYERDARLTDAAFGISFFGSYFVWLIAAAAIYLVVALWGKVVDACASLPSMSTLRVVLPRKKTLLLTSCFVGWAVFGLAIWFTSIGIGNNDGKRTIVVRRSVDALAYVKTIVMGSTAIGVAAAYAVR